MNDYEIYSLDVAPTVSEFYQNIDASCKISNIDISYLTDVITVDGEQKLRCPLVYAAWDILKYNFDIYYATREIGGETEFDFFNMLQSCFNRNADTYETQLEFYYKEVNKPVIGRTEKIIYDVTDKREQDVAALSKSKELNKSGESGNDMNHHVEVPADNPDEDTDRSRDKTDYGRKVDVEDYNAGSSVSAMDDEQKRTGTQTTEISSLGIKPNVEYMNEYLENNKTFIQYFIESFEECFAPRYKKVYF